MSVQDFFSLCNIYHPTWTQVDRRYVEQLELWLFRPLYYKTGKHAVRGEVHLWQISFRLFIESSTNQDWFNCLDLLIQTQKKSFQWWNQQTIAWIRCWTPPSSGRIWKRLGQRKQIWKSLLTKFLQKLPNFFRNFCNLFHIILRPQCTFGTKKSKKSTAGTPSKMVLFQKTWWKRVKEHSFNLFTDRAIVENCVAVILPPQLTL